jgi:hypothetical protein
MNSLETLEHKNNSKKLLYIQQAIHESIFLRIAASTKSKEVYDILRFYKVHTRENMSLREIEVRRDFENLSMEESKSIS